MDAACLPRRSNNNTISNTDAANRIMLLANCLGSDCGDVYSNVFENNTLSKGANYFDVYSFNNSANLKVISNNFTNNAMNRTNIGFGQGNHNLTIRWFVTVNVTQGASPLSGFTVNITDNSSRTEFYGITGSNGIAIATINDIKLSSNTQNITYNNHIIAINKTGSGLAASSKSWNITGSVTINFTYAAITFNQTITPFGESIALSQGSEDEHNYSLIEGPDGQIIARIDETGNVFYFHYDQVNAKHL